MTVKRIAVSIEPELLEKLEKSMRRRVYRNRSKAVSDVLRAWFSRDEWAAGKGRRVGAISICYDHHTPRVLDRITDIQHEHGATVIATLHVHISHRECLEVLVAKGNAEKIRKIADSLASVRGVKSCSLSAVA
ncbi:MAG: nickel-responsive transcriptional regulator NikR [Candidatus ainarchaeum sp.]|nr:nickel-responsive transcriptional regulator NikR [Candidatus ainarchaeum sp.]